jgi:hypothetical protein
MKLEIINQNAQVAYIKMICMIPKSTEFEVMQPDLSKET